MTIRRNRGKNPLLYLLLTIRRESELEREEKRVWIERLTKLEVDRIMRSEVMRKELARLRSTRKRN